MLPGRCPVGLPGVLLGAAGLLPGCRVGRRTDPHIGGLACQAAGLPARLPGTVAARLLPGPSECPGLPGPGPSEHTRHPPGRSTASVLAIVHFGSVGRLCGLFERSKAT